MLYRLASFIDALDEKTLTREEGILLLHHAREDLFEKEYAKEMFALIQAEKVEALDQLQETYQAQKEALLQETREKVNDVREGAAVLILNKETQADLVAEIEANLKPAKKPGHAKEAGRMVQELDFQGIRQALGRQAERIFDQHLMGASKKTHGIQIEYKSQDYKMTLHREKGVWHDFKSGQGGDIVQFLEMQWGLPAKGAGSRTFWEKAAEVAGSRASFEKDVRTPKVKSLSTREGPHPEKTHQAEKLYKNSEPLKGTAGEGYLRDHRGIQKASFSEDLRFLPHKTHPALLAFARNEEGRVTGGQMIYLDPESHKKADMDVAKRSFGALKGSAVHVQLSPSSEVLYVAEGVETALSLVEAGVEGEVVATLGVSNMKSFLRDPVHQRIILCADNDGPYAATQRVIYSVASHLLSLGKTVEIVMPSHLKEDMNDILKKEGPEGIHEALSQPLTPETRQGTHLFDP